MGSITAIVRPIAAVAARLIIMGPTTMIAVWPAAIYVIYYLFLYVFVLVLIIVVIIIFRLVIGNALYSRTTFRV